MCKSGFCDEAAGGCQDAAGFGAADVERHAFILVGWTPRSAWRPPGRHLEFRVTHDARETSTSTSGIFRSRGFGERSGATRGSPADQGVRPTVFTVVRQIAYLKTESTNQRQCYKSRSGPL